MGDECDRLMGIGSVECSSGEDRDGDGELTESEVPTVGIADSSTTKIDTCHGAVESSQGVGSASLAEVLKWNKMPSQDNPATCAPQGSTEFPRFQHNLRQVDTYLLVNSRKFIKTQFFKANNCR